MYKKVFIYLSGSWWLYIYADDLLCFEAQVVSWCGYKHNIETIAKVLGAEVTPK